MTCGSPPESAICGGEQNRVSDAPQDRSILYGGSESAPSPCSAEHCCLHPATAGLGTGSLQQLGLPGASLVSQTLSPVLSTVKHPQSQLAWLEQDETPCLNQNRGCKGPWEPLRGPRHLSREPAWCGRAHISGQELGMGYNASCEN